MLTKLQKAHAKRYLMNERMPKLWRDNDWVNKKLVDIEQQYPDFTVLWPTGDTVHDRTLLRLIQQDPTNNKVLIPQNNGNHWYGTAYTRTEDEWSAHTIHTRADGTCGDSLVEEAEKIAKNASDAQTNKTTLAPATNPTTVISPLADTPAAPPNSLEHGIQNSLKDSSLSNFDFALFNMATEPNKTNQHKQSAITALQKMSAEQREIAITRLKDSNLNELCDELSSQLTPVKSPSPN